ncbi:MAG TPA: EAL domain-containing protein, partial [Woeseiaceae bacterium]
MQFIVSQVLNKHQALRQLARELSLSLSYFERAEELSRLLRGDTRRIVMLTESDVSAAAIGALEKAMAKATFGLILCTDRERLRSTNRAALLDQITTLSNVEWIRSDWDLDTLSRATRSCRRRMLRVSRQEIEQAVANRQFLIQYQPKVDRGISGVWQTSEVEALIRWRHPAHGLLGPLEFLPEVEAFGLSADVAEYVLGETAAQIVQWRKSGLNLNGCINLASSLLGNTTLADRYVAIVAQHGLDCASFTFEVTEQEIVNSDAP